MPGADANVPRLSFSAALTKPMTGSGTIVFDKTFVNEGNRYNPSTGESYRINTSEQELTRTHMNTNSIFVTMTLQSLQSFKNISIL